MSKTTWGIAIALMCAAACGKKSDKPATPDESAKTTEPAKDGVPSDEAIAYALGHKIGMIDAFVVMKKPDSAADDLAKAKDLADALGVDAPHLPASGEHEADAIGKQLLAKKSEKVAYSFMLGYQITYAWFGTELGADTAGPIADIEASAKKSGIPESEWRVRYDQIKAKPDADQLDQLEKGLQAYLEHGAK